MAKIQNKQKPIKFTSIDKVSKRTIKAQKTYDKAAKREADIVREEKNQLER